MKKKLFALLVLFTLIVSACGSNSATQSQATTPQVSTSAPSSATEVSSPPVETPVPESLRQASISELENDVQIRLSQGAEFTPAQVGSVIPVGGSIQTGDNSRARVDLLPEGTIIRMAPNSLFTVNAVETTDGQPKTKLQLFFGKVWVLLAGGELDVQTETGVASVRGSLLSVSYDPDTKTVKVTCLEGDCGLRNNKNDDTSLTDGQSCEIDKNTLTCIVDQMTEDEIKEWLSENPEATNFFSGDLPDWLLKIINTPEPTSPPSLTEPPTQDSNKKHRDDNKDSPPSTQPPETQAP